MIGASILTGNAATQANETKSEVWWSLKPVVRPALPDGSEHNPIDRFINAALKRRGLEPVGARMQLAAPAAVDFSSEPDHVKSLYGIGEKETEEFGKQLRWRGA